MDPFDAFIVGVALGALLAWLAAAIVLREHWLKIAQHYTDIKQAWERIRRAAQMLKENT